MTQKSIIIDLDGTLVANQNRPPSMYIEPTGGTDWDAWNADAVADPPAKWCVDMVEAMYEKGYKILFVTGRREIHRQTAVNWLTHHLPDITDYELFMRRENDFREASVTKLDLLTTKILPRYDVVFAVDDLKENCEMFRSLGIIALHCADY